MDPHSDISPTATQPTDSNWQEDANRRQFLGTLLAGAAAMAAASCTPPQTAAAAPTPQPAKTGTDAAAPAAAAPAKVPPHASWDLSWTERLTGKHKMVFDAPEIAEGNVLHAARMFYTNYKEVYDWSDSDISAVLVFRHEALPAVLGDPVWEKYDFIGHKITKLKDPTTGEWARRNPFLNAKPDDKHALVWPDGGLDTLIGRGAIVVACNLAFRGFARVVAEKTNQTHDAVVEEFKASLVKGVTLVPSGIFGVIRAEQAGCSFLRCT